jgi:TolA-binding protein
MCMASLGLFLSSPVVSFLVMITGLLSWLTLLVYYSISTQQRHHELRQAEHHNQTTATQAEGQILFDQMRNLMEGYREQSTDDKTEITQLRTQIANLQTQVTELHHIIALQTLEIHELRQQLQQQTPATAHRSLPFPQTWPVLSSPIPAMSASSPPTATLDVPALPVSIPVNTPDIAPSIAPPASATTAMAARPSRTTTNRSARSTTRSLLPPS